MAMTAAENYMLPYWDQVIEDSQTKEQYGKRQREGILLRLLGQMAIPIEAALADDTSED
jgi:hypothetical protein